MPSGVLNYQAKNLYVNLRCLRQRAVGDTMSVTTDRKAVIPMLNENIKTIRKSKGLSQEELAVKLNVVRQTVSKWEQGLSVPDSDMLISLSDALETPVSTLLGGADIARQPISQLEFRRPGDGGFRHGLSCVRVAVCPIRADCFCRFARRSFYDAKEIICLICPLPIKAGGFFALKMRRDVV